MECYISQLLLGKPLSKVLQEILKEDSTPRIDFQVVQTQAGVWTVYKIHTPLNKTNRIKEEIGSFTNPEEAQRFAAFMSKGIAKTYFQQKGGGASKIVQNDDVI